MSRDICFATQGELVKLAYDAFGVLPRKDACHDDIDETQKKAIQKQLERLAKEEGGLLSNFGQVTQTLSSILKGQSPAFHQFRAERPNALSGRSAIRERHLLADSWSALRCLRS